MIVNIGYRIAITGIALIFISSSVAQNIQGRRNMNTVLLLPGTSTTPAQKNNYSPDLETIRKRIIDDLLQPAVNVNDIKHLITSLKPDGTWPGIDYVDTSRTGFQHSHHLDNMLNMSMAYKKPGSPLYKNADLKRAISSSLDYWIQNDFICQNWWWNEMGTPGAMINVLLLMDTDLTEKQKTEGARIANRANLEASGARPGGDLIQIAGMLGKQGLFARNEEVVSRVVKVMGDEIKVTTGRGLKPDLSFHHRIDNVISIHTYGTGYASAFAYWAVKTAGTKFTLPDTALKLLIDYYLDGICKAMIHGQYPDPGAKNRDLSRKNALSPIGPELPENLIKASGYRKNELEEIIKIRKGEKRPALTHNRFFWHSEYFTHQRPNYFASVRMHSSRNHNMEQPHNEEGLKNHHFADGSNFVSITGTEYFNIFPVMDWQKIPGSTVVQKPDVPHWKDLAKKGLTNFVGGVSDGKYGAAAFDFASPHDPLKARKSWFFFDREYVCLGAGITADTDYPVVTTLNQCLLKKDVVANSNNSKTVVNKGSHSLSGVSWIAHNKVAYLFPSPADVKLSNNTATGNWRQINHQAWATEDPVKEEVFTLWIDHGAKPINKNYAYIVIPGIEPSAIADYNKKADISVLSNSPEIQAVQQKGSGITQVVFYKPGTIKISNDINLTADNACMVMIKAAGKSVEQVSVSDPTRKLDVVQLKLSSQFKGSDTNWQSVWNKETNTSLITVNLPQTEKAGSSVVMKMNNTL